MKGIGSLLGKKIETLLPNENLIYQTVMADEGGKN